METDTIKLLRECNAGIKMGESSINQVLSHVRSQELKQALENCKSTHSILSKETEKLLSSYGEESKDSHPIAKVMGNMKISASMIMGGDDKKIAELMTDGCDMGIKTLTGYLNKYKMADEKAVNIAKRLISSEEYLESKMRKFL